MFFKQTLALLIALAPFAAEAKEKKEDTWIRKYKPQAHQLELGVFGGMITGGSKHELFKVDPSADRQGYKDLHKENLELGMRLGYYPLTFLGVEGELGWGLMKAEGKTADLLMPRASAILQYPRFSVVPFLSGGYGLMSMRSPSTALGVDTDPNVHFGGGVKVNFTDRIQARVDVRDNVSFARGATGLTHHKLEVLAGLSLRFGGKKKPVARKKPVEKKPVVEPAPAPAPEPAAKDPVCALDGVSLRNIHFAFDRDEIRPDSFRILDAAVKLLKDSPYADVLIVGHTDSRGSDKYNDDLSMRRAERVKSYLVRHGIAPERIETQGAGEKEPVASNKQDDGRWLNRRIEFHVLTDGLCD